MSKIALNGRGIMRQHLAMLVTATACGWILAVQAGARSTESKTKVKAEHGKTVTYIGCVQSGNETRTYMRNAVPMSRTESRAQPQLRHRHQAPQAGRRSETLFEADCARQPYLPGCDRFIVTGKLAH